MAAIKSIKVGETTYDLKATYDGAGNVIDTTYAKANAIPTKISQLQNDSGYLTEHQDISELATKGELEGKVDKELGKGLSTNDYTDEDKKKLTDIKPITTGSFNNAPNEVSLILERYGAGVPALSMTLPPATSEKSGVMRNIDKAKLDSIEESANNYVHPTTSGNKHIPSGGAFGQILVFSADGTAEWADSSSKLEEQFTALNEAWEELQKAQQKLDKQVTELNSNMDLYSYGVEWDVTVASLELTRIGNPLLHKSLPIQSAYRGCVANNDVVNYYLFPDDWSYKEDGETPSVLDGTDGTVRVNTPKFYGKSGSDGNKRWVRTSTVKIDDSWVEIPELLIDAYRSTVDTTVSATPKAVSVVNTTTAFRGGGNRANYDDYLTTELETKDIFRSDLGKPRTNISRATMRTYATNAGSELLCYEYYKWIFYWNYVIEYANFNSQAAYNAELTADGYHQGGLGPGVTDWANAATSWSGYNATYPLTPCGYCNEFGNFTGVKDLVIPECTAQDGTNTVATHTFKVPRWRGFDNPFGDIWTNLDGVVIVRAAANEISTVYTTTNVSEFTDVVGEKTVAGYEVASDGYIKAFDLGETAEIIPSAVGGSATTYICDYHYCNASSTALRTLQVGGGAYYGGDAGLGCFYSNDDVGRAYSSVGFRTLNRVS